MKNDRLIHFVTMVICYHVVTGFSMMKRAGVGEETGGLVPESQMAAERKSQCRGGFDVYFLLDR